MVILTIIIIAIGLSMDAFAVSLCCGAMLQDHKNKTAFKVGGFFGGFQLLMPLAGWAIGGLLRNYIEAVDHWIAFVLLAFIGGKMIYEAIKNRSCQRVFNINKISVLFTLAVATSIDALIAGLSIGLLDMPVLVSVLIIGCITFAISFAGVHLGKRYVRVLGNKAEIAGGIVLIAIGLKILIEHLWF